MSGQLLKSYAQIAEALPQAKLQFVQDYSALKDSLANNETAVSELLTLIESFKPLFGAQTPENNIESNSSQVYFDTTNSPTSVDMYFNDTIGSLTGWVKVV